MTSPGSETRDDATSALGPVAGLWAPLCTPLDDGGAVDSARLAEHASRMLAEGCHGVVLFGTTGEGTSLSVAEREEALEALVSAGLGPNDAVVSTGCAAAADTVRLSSHALGLGFSRLLVLPPFYYKDVDEEGLFRSFATVVDTVADSRMRLYLYHIPRLSGVTITPGLLGRLIDEYGPMVAGLKDTSGDPDATEHLVRSYPDLAIVPGDEYAMLRLLRAGAGGCITATANVNAGPLRALYDMWRDGDDGADVSQVRALAFRRLIQSHPPIPALKYLISRRTGDPSWRRMRPPLVPLDDESGRRLELAIAEAR